MSSTLNRSLRTTNPKEYPCRDVNQEIQDDPMFWLKKFIERGLSKKNQLDWTKAIQLTKGTNLERNIFLYLKTTFENDRVVDLPCYFLNLDF